MIKQRPFKLKERDITIQIRNYLKAKGVFHWKNWAGIGSQKGIPDISGVLKGGRALFIEVKTDSGRVSDHQKRFLRDAIENGAVAFVARSVEDVISVLKSFG